MNKVATVARARPYLALVPLILLGGLVAIFLLLGPAGIFPGEFPPVEDLSIQRVTLEEGFIKVSVTNGGPDPVTIAQVLVDEAYWEHTVEPSRTISRLRSATMTIPYPWVEGEPVGLTIISSTGVTFSHDIEVATETPGVTPGFLTTFALVGIYIGVVPVFLGMTWLPLLRTLDRRWVHFFMATTAGILLFLGVETLVEALEQSESLPTALGGVGVVTVSAVGAFALIFAGSRRLAARGGIDTKLLVAYGVAAGIGLHNLGEGLAVGAAYRLGEIALGAFLVIGFAVHNTTEGLGIVSLLSDRRAVVRHLILLGAIAGIPTIFGAWIGAFVFSPLLASVFLAIAAGAIAQVVVEVLGVVKGESGTLASLESLVGIAFGIAVMYATGLLVAA